MFVDNNYLRTSSNGAKEVAVVVDEAPTTTAGEATVTAFRSDGPAQPEDPAIRLAAVDHLLSQLHDFMRQMKRGVATLEGLRRDGIEYAAYGLLAHLVMDGPKRTTALAEAVHADPSTVSRQTAALVRHGLLERRPDPEDGRASILAATPDGERVFRDNRREHVQWMAETLHGWSMAEVEQLAGLLARLNGNVCDFFRTHEARGGTVLDFRGRKS